MKPRSILTIAITATLISTQTYAETFDFNSGPASGNYFWNVGVNWDTDAVPNGSGATANIPAPTGNLTITLGQPITVGLLDISKPVSPTASTAIAGTDPLTIAGGSQQIVNHASSANTGVTTIDVPVQITTTLTVNQESNDLLTFNGVISGGTGLTLTRVAGGNGFRTIVLNNANTYGGTTTTLNGGGADLALVVRLGDANAIPTGTINAFNSVVFELAAGDFTKTVATGGQVVFSGGRNGWGAIGTAGTDRHIKIGNVTTSVTFASLNVGQMVLGTPNSTVTTIFDNALALGGSERNFRVYNGSAAIDGEFSNVISGTGILHKNEDGVLRLTAANTYSGGTIIEGGVLRIDGSSSLPSGTLGVQIGGGGTLGIGNDLASGDPTLEFTRAIGTGAGQIQLSVPTGASGNNQANAGFAAFGGDRRVLLTTGVDNTLVWNSNILTGGSGTPSRNLILSHETATGTLELKNPIDFNGALRTFVVRNGSTDVDAILSGTLKDDVVGSGGGFTKDNSGTLVVTGNNTYTGGTNVIDGRLLVNNGAGSGTGPGPVTVSTNAILGGTGSIAGTVTVNATGHVAPGASIGSLGVGGLTLNDGSILDFELGAPGTGDLLNVTSSGGLAVNGGGVNIINAGGLNFGTYTLITYSGAIGGDGGIFDFLNTMATGPNGFSYLLNNTGSSITLSVGDADFNNDTIVDAADYVIWAKNNSITGTGTNASGDATGDGNVDAADYIFWRRTFGATIAGAGTSLASNSAVPEPTTLALLVMATLFAIGNRRR